MLPISVVIDYLNARDPFYEKARLPMIAGFVGDFDLWITSSQVTELICVLSNGGTKSLVPSAPERLRGLRSFVNVYAATGLDIDHMLATAWGDLEYALLFEAALGLKADCIVTRDREGFESAVVPARSCEELFDWLRAEAGIDYDEVAL